MPRRLYIPKQVIESITDHLNSAIDMSVDGFWSANEDEDTITGHLGGCLRTGNHNVEVTQDEINGTWKWSIDYAKFRGRGKNATESFLGADGIIELVLTFGSRTESKAILFQSKVDWQSDQELVKQAVLLSTWREAAIAINYTPDGFNAYSIDSILASKGEKKLAKGELNLKQALAEHFLECKIGNTDISYDAKARKLVWRDTNGVRVATQFSIPHRVRIEIQSPTYKKKFNFDKLIPIEEIHVHRMQVEPEEVLMPLLSNIEETTKARKRFLAMTYHPDRYSPFDQLFKDLATKRMQEVNAAFDEMKKREK